MRRLLPLLLTIWLTWTNPPDLDYEYVRFFATQDGRADTLWTAPYYRHGVNADGTTWERSRPGGRDSCNYTIPRGSWYVGCVAGDTTGRNESNPSNIVSFTIVSADLALGSPSVGTLFQVSPLRTSGTSTVRTRTRTGTRAPRTTR